MKLTSLLVVFTAAFTVTACRQSTDQRSANGPDASLPPIRVAIATVDVETAPSLTEITGTVRPVARAQLAAKVMGTIEDMPVGLGQRVSRGDVLVRVSAGEIAARVAQAKSSFNTAQRDLDRERELLEKGASTATTVRGLEDRFAAAEAMLREAETMLGYTLIRAPFDGVVARKHADTGDLAAPGLPLLDVEGTQAYWIEAAIPGALVPGLSVGADLTVELPTEGKSFRGELAELSPATEANAHSVLVRIAVPQEVAVRSGQFARVRVPGPAATALLVPSAAVTRVGQMERVFVADPEGRAELRLVKSGARRGDQVEILAGVDPKERVVLAPPAGLREGQPLELPR